MSARINRVLQLEAAIGAHLFLANRRKRQDPARVHDRYEIRSVIGTGAFGTVVLGWDPNIEREVAIKCIPVDDPWREFDTLAIEAKALADVKAAEVVGIHDCCPTILNVNSKRIPCLVIVMEYVPGRSLRQWGMSSHSEDQRLGVLISAARGLEAAHASGIVHRDFKPENVIVDKANNARVVDFGLAYRISRASQSTQLALRGQVGMGTPEYMAPEVYAGETSPRSDQFAFALTAWEVLADARPFDPTRGHWSDTEPRQFRGAKRLRRDLIRILARGLKRDPRDRFDDLGSLRQALQDRLDSAGTIAGVAAAGAVLLGAAAAAVALTANRDRDDHD